MNIFSIEKARNELLNFLENTSSRRLKVKRISEFFALLIEQKSYTLIESYLLEFLPKYLDYLKTYSPIGIKPEFTQSIVQINTKLNEVIESAEYKEKLREFNLEIENKLLTLNKIIAGEEVGISEERKAFFPLIEDEEGKSINQTVGAIDSITIKLSKAKQKDKFIIVPSETENDTKLEEQINICWEKAKEFSKKYVRKLSLYHEIIISFDGNLGVYRGESLGAALTIAMIEELLRYYNSLTVLKPIIGTAFTGGISESGKVYKVSKVVVEKKVEIVFYSNCQTLAVPKEDEPFALYKLDELYKCYPKRNLRIVGVNDLEEILLRRDLVEIKKQRLIVRTGKFIKKNWISAIVTVLLAILFTFLFVMDWDDNPAMFAIDGSNLFIKNRNDKILWRKNFPLAKIIINEPRLFSTFIKIVDINNDGLNEVLLLGEKNDSIGSSADYKILRCYDAYGNVIWKYTFEKQVYSQRETLNTEYGIKILDTLYFEGMNSLYLISTNITSFSSAIFRISLSNGKRLPGTLWCSGHITSGIIKDINNDGKKELICLGYDNGYEDVVLFACEIDTLTKVRLTTYDYLIRNYETADMLAYIRFPKVDYDIFYQNRTPAINPGILNYKNDNRIYDFCTSDPNDEKHAGIGYEVQEDFKTINIVIDSNFRVRRDSLVALGKLKPPYTDTKEYIDIIKSQILFWKNGKWVKREELD